MGGSGIVSKFFPLLSADATFSLGRKCGSVLPAGSILALRGNLGAGKTTFVQGVASALRIEAPIQSPTFIYLNTYEGTLPLYHFDLYRMKSASDFFSLGFDEYFVCEGIVAIEWAERLGKDLPESAFTLDFSYEEDGRILHLSSPIDSKLIESMAAWD